MKNYLEKIGLPRIIIIVFLIIVVLAAYFLEQDMGIIATDVLVRFGMFGILGLAMMPAVLSGTGLNFGLPVGIICGVLGGLVSLEFNLTSWAGFFVAILVALPFAILLGYLYGKLLNAVKGSEMVVGTYVGYSIVSLMCIFWLVLPFKNPKLIWPIGGSGLRTTITLDGYYSKVLNSFLSFNIGGIKVPVGLLLFFALACYVIYVFSKSKTGIMMKTAGSNEVYANAAGISVNKMRITGTILSTVLGAIGIIVYAQSFGFYQLYTAPLNMAFAPVAAVLLGGASTSDIKISHVVIGTFLFQALITIAMPVANQLAPEGGLSDVSRIIVSNAIILYALTQSGGKK